MKLTSSHVGILSWSLIASQSGDVLFHACFSKIDSSIWKGKNIFFKYILFSPVKAESGIIQSGQKIIQL